MNVVRVPTSLITVPPENKLNFKGQNASVLPSNQIKRLYGIAWGIYDARGKEK